MSRRLQIAMIVFFSLLWIGGGIAFDAEGIILAGAIASLAWLVWVLLLAQPLKFPTHSEWLFGLIGVLVVSLWWSLQRMNTLQHILLTVSGVPFLIGARTMAGMKGFSEVVRRSILVAGVVFTLLWVGQVIIADGERVFGASSLVAEASGYKNHNHLGDWWMVMLMLTVGGRIAWQWVTPGIIMLWAARSRSADLGALVGWGYIGWIEGWWGKYRKRIVVGTVVLVGLFFGMGLKKSTLSSRDYFVQAVAGVFKYPYGVGLGNFDLISRDPATQWWGNTDFSSIVHNVALEWLTGMGGLAVVGWVWLMLVSWKMGEGPCGTSFQHKKKMWRAVYWALLINFMFDTTYFVPSMWWLFMVVIGLGEE